MEPVTSDSLIASWLEYVSEKYPDLTDEQKASMTSSKEPVFKVMADLFSSSKIEMKPDSFVHSEEQIPTNIIHAGFSTLSMPADSTHYLDENVQPGDFFYVHQYADFTATIYPPTGTKFSDGERFKVLKKGMVIGFEYDGGVTFVVRSFHGEKKQLKPTAHAFFLSLSAYTYDNGDNGIGATITYDALGHGAYASGQWAEFGDVVLVFTEEAYNGLYIVTNPGDDSSNYFELTRHPDMDEPSEIGGAIIFVAMQNGTLRDTIWMVDGEADATWEIGTSEIDLKPLNSSRDLKQVVHSYDAPYTIPNIKYPIGLFVYDGNADGTINLPASDNGNGREFTFKNISSGNLTISVQGTDALDSSTTIVLSPHEYAKVADVASGVWGRIG